MPTRQPPPSMVARAHALVAREAHLVNVFRSYIDFVSAHGDALFGLALGKRPYDAEEFEYHSAMLATCGQVVRETLERDVPAAEWAAMAARAADGHQQLALAEHAVAHSRTPAEKAENKALRDGAYVRYSVLSAAAAVRQRRREVRAATVAIH